MKRDREGRRGENVRELDAQEGRRTERERKERDALIERGIKGLGRETALEKGPGIHKDDASYDS